MKADDPREPIAYVVTMLGRGAPKGPGTPVYEGDTLTLIPGDSLTLTPHRATLVTLHTKPLKRADEGQTPATVLTENIVLDL